MLYIPHYIDPGTGSMLFTILIGVVSAGVYALRNAIVKARFVMSGGRQDKQVGNETVPIVIFTDSKRYWNIFGPICDELERRGQKASYLTASPDDPALERDYEHVTCEFIGEGNKAFARMNMLRAEVVLSTTPGLDVYQWKRSRDVKRYVHVPHAVSDLTLYRMFGIDYYDAVLLTGEYQADQVRALEAAHNLEPKELVVVGSTQMDELARKVKTAAAAGEKGVVAESVPAENAEAPSAPENAANAECAGIAGSPTAMENMANVDGAIGVEDALGAESPLVAMATEDIGADGRGSVPTVLVAPSWGKSALLSLYGTRVIDALIESGYHVIVRPHPQSFTSEREMLDGLMAARPESEQLEWNCDNDNFAVLSRADVLVSDFSGVILDYALAFDRAVVYTQPRLDLAPYDACWLDEQPWTFGALPRIGEQLDDDNIDRIGELVERCLDASRFAQSRAEVRAECWAYPGEATIRAVDYLISQLERDETDK